MAEIVQHLDAAIASGRNMVDATSHLVKVNELLKGVPGAVALIDNHELVSAITSRLNQVSATIALIDEGLENAVADSDELERNAAALIALRDVEHEELFVDYGFSSNTKHPDWYAAVKDVGAD